VNPEKEKLLKRLNDIIDNIDNLDGEKINDKIKSIAYFDYRTTEEKQVDAFVDSFLQGGLFTEVVPDIERTARNSPKYTSKTNPKEMAKRLKATDFNKVQKPFWQKYKHKYSKNKLFATSPKLIYKLIKEA
jgi:hypothetical protein